MQTVSNWLSHPGPFRGLLAAQLVIGAGIGISAVQLLAATGGIGLLDFRFGYDLEDVTAHFTAYDGGGWALVQRILLLDLVNPALYGLLLVAVLGRLGAAPLLLWLPIATAVLDYAENAVIYGLIRAWPELPGGLVSFGNLLSLAKQACLALTVLALIGAVLRWQQA